MTTKTVERDVAEESPTEFEVTDDLYRVSEATNDDGTVDVEIIDFERCGYNEKTVAVTFRTPMGEKREETMDWPRKDSTDYKFVRICNETVGSLSGAQFLKTDGAEIRADPEEWEIVTKKPLWRRIINLDIEGNGDDLFGAILFGPMASIVVVMEYLFGELDMGNSRDSYIIGMAEISIGLFAWIFCLLIIGILLA